MKYAARKSATVPVLFPQTPFFDDNRQYVLLLSYAVMNVEAIEQEDGSLQVLLDAKPLTCSVCGNQRYHERGFMLNTRSSEFLGAAWADDKASNFICTRCGYIFWFVIKEIKRSRLVDPPDLPLVDRIFGRERP